MKKRSPRIVLFLLLMLLTMTACGGQSTDTAVGLEEGESIETPETETEEWQSPELYEEVEEDSTEKTVITIGTLEEWEDLESLVSKFNASSEDYVAQIQLYESQMVLNTHILGGDGPDVVFLHDFPYLQYIQRGIFLDVSEILDAVDYEPALRQMISTQFDDQIAIITYQFSCIAAPEYVLEGRTAWTFDEFTELAEETNTFQKFYKDTVLSLYCASNLSEYLDTAENTCNFESEAFYAALEFVNRFLDEGEETLSDGKGADIQLTASVPYLSELDMDWYDMLFWGGSPSTYLGFPSNTGEEILVTADLQFAIPYSASEVDGAKAFLTYALSEEFQQDQAELLRFSVLHGLQYEWLESYFSSGDYAEGPIAEEMAAKLEDMWSRTTAIAYVDDTIYEIIAEEAASYFNGDKTVEEVAHLIQSRAQLYLDEQA